MVRVKVIFKVFGLENSIRRYRYRDGFGGGMVV